MKRDEFAVFWDAHQRLPLSKIQLRKIHRDNLPHSPVGVEDRISADLFMLRKQSKPFREFLQERLPDVAYNPGKQSV